MDRGGGEGEGGVGGGTGRSHDEQTGVPVRRAFHPDRPMKAAAVGRRAGTMTVRDVHTLRETNLRLLQQLPGLVARSAPRLDF